MKKISSLVVLTLSVIFVMSSILPSTAVGLRQGTSAGALGNVWDALSTTVSRVAQNPPLPETGMESEPSDAAGSTFGEFSVSPGGAALYTIPIGVPPGTHGVEPELSLTYNSQQKNGVLGMGFSMNGIPSITRCNANPADDGFYGGIHFDAQDRFCLDGIRLVALEDKNGNYMQNPDQREKAYGQDGTIYHTKKETWTKIISRGQCGSGPCFFDAWNKDGWHLEFGNTPDSIVQRSATQPDILTWSINRTTDLNGNYVTISYTNNGADYYPRQIDYTGNTAAQLSPQRSVRFGYESRNDPITRYVAGVQIQQTERMNMITTYVGETLVKTFKLSYEYGSTTGRSRMTGVQECDASNVCLPATSFSWIGHHWNMNPEVGSFNVTNDSVAPGNWINSTPSAASTVGDFNGDGLTDIALSNTGWGSVPVYFSNGDGSFNITNNSTISQNWINQGVAAHTIGGDFNGDGLSDILLTGIKGMNSVPIYFSVPENPGTFNITNAPIPLATNWIEGNSNARVIPGDFNGDGKTDIALAAGDNGWQTIPVYFSNGDGTFTLTNNFIPADMNWINDVTTSGSQEIIPADYKVMSGDYNGDGLTDIALSGIPGSQTIPVYASKGDGNFSVTDSPISNDANQINTPTNANHTYTGDYNGDGRTDIAVLYALGASKSDSFSTYLSNGDGSFLVQPSTYAGFTLIESSKIIPGDYNGDGLTDFMLAGLVLQGGSGNTVKIYFSQGDGTYNFIDNALPAGAGNWINTAVNAAVTPGDFNGDGITDIALSQDGWNTVPVYFSTIGNGVENDLIGSITNGLNGQMNIEYSPLTDSDVYTKSSAASSYPVRDAAGPFMVVSSYSSIPNSADPANWTTCAAEGSRCNINGNTLVRFGAGNAWKYAYFQNSLDCSTNTFGGNPALNIVKSCSTFSGQSYTYNYLYTGARLSLDGHGWLGFETVEMDDMNSALPKRSIVTYRQDFPFNGLIDHSTVEVLASGWQPLVTTQLKHNTLAPYPNSGPLVCPQSEEFPQTPYSCAIFQITTTDDLTNNYSIEQGSGQSTLNFQLEKQYGFDGYGNANLVSDLGYPNDPGDDVFTCILYDNNPELWQLGYISQKKVTASAGDCNDLVYAPPNQVPGPEQNWSPDITLSWEKTTYVPNNRNILSQQDWYEAIAGDAVAGHWSGPVYTYDPYGNILTITNSAGFTTTVNYDATYHTFPVHEISPSIANSLQQQNPGSHTLTTSFQYDPRFGVLKKVQDPNGNTEGQLVDGFGRQVGSTGPNPESTSGGSAKLQKLSFAYDPTSQAFYTTTTTRPDWDQSSQSAWYYSKSYIDGMLRQYQTVAQGPDSTHDIISQTQFDPEGRIWKESLPYYQNNPVPWNTTTYNLHNHPELITAADGTMQQITYDQQKGTITTTEAADTPDQSTTIRTIDSRGQTVQKVSPNGLVTDYTYTLLGQLTSITNHSERGDIVSTVTYDSLGRERTLTSPDTGTLTLHYDINDRLDYEVDGNGQKTEYTYDAIGRPVTQTTTSTSNEVSTITFAYDESATINGQGELTSVNQTGDTNQVSYEFPAYTPYGEIATASALLDNTLYTHQYTYDALGRISQIIYPDGAVFRPGYAPGGYLQSLTLAPDSTSPFQTYATYSNYTAQSQPETTQYGNGLQAIMQYAPLPGMSGGQLDSSILENAEKSIAQTTYQWNFLHRVREIDYSSPSLNYSKQFAYDPEGMGRLISAQGPYGSQREVDTKEYQYDLIGNITQKDGITYTYESGSNRLQSASNGLSVEYDNEGNVTDKKLDGTDWKYTYNGDNRLTQVHKDTQLVESYAYDFQGSRWKKTETLAVNGTTQQITTYYVSPYYEVAILPDGSQLHTKYVQGPAGPVAAITTNSQNQNTAALIDRNNQTALERSSPLTNWLNDLRENSAVVLRHGFSDLPYLLAFLTFLAIAILISRKITTNYTRRHPLLGKMVLPFLMFCLLFGEGGIALGALEPGTNGVGYPEAGETLYFYDDVLGSTTVVTDSTGSVVSTTDYMPYGEINQNISSGKDNFRPKFTGKEWDSSARLYAFGDRYYDPDLGQFTRPDPARQFFSPYIYGNDDPEDFVDPDGDFAWLIVALIVIGATSGAYFGGAAVNHDFNPAHWDWKAGKTYAGIFGGAAIGGIAGAASGALAEAGVGLAAGIAGEALIGAGENAAFTAMGGGSAKEILESAAIGAAAGAILSLAGRGLAAAGSRIYSRFARRGGQIAEAGEEAAEEAQVCQFSFPAGTMVKTEQGTMPIEQIRPHDQVWARDEADKSNGIREVEQMFTRTAEGLIVMTLTNGEKVSATPEHPFYVEGKGWEELEDIRPGDEIATLEGPDVAVAETRADPGSIQVYNFQVNEDHNYFVGPDGLWVHNVSCTKQVRTNGKKQDVITATLSAKGATGTATNAKVRVAVNDPKARIPKKVTAELYEINAAGKRVKTGIKVAVDNKPIKGVKWDAGHVVANSNGGTGRDVVNIFPQNRSVNRGGTWRFFEDDVHTQVNANPSKKYEQQVTLHY